MKAFDYEMLRQTYPDLGERLDAFNASVVALPISADQKAHIISMSGAVMLAYGLAMGQAIREAIAENMGLNNA